MDCLDNKKPFFPEGFLLLYDQVPYLSSGLIKLKTMAAKAPPPKGPTK